MIIKLKHHNSQIEKPLSGGLAAGMPTWMKNYDASPGPYLRAFLLVGLAQNDRETL